MERLLIGDMTLEKLLHEMWGKYAIPTPARAKKVDALPGTEWFREEIRGELYPVVETACAEQLAHVREYATVSVQAMERIVREAHGAHDIVAHVPHQVHLLGQGGGYVKIRPSRI